MARIDKLTQMILDRLQAGLERILTLPTPEDLWDLQSDLLAIGGEEGLRSRAVVGEFYKYLRTLESKSASRRASRVGAALATGAVSSVGIQEMIIQQAAPLRGLLSNGVTAMLEIGSAFQIARAWDIEASLMYSDLAWYLYGELWEISAFSRPGLSVTNRQKSLDLLIRPILEKEVADEIKSVLVIRLFQAIVTARMLPILQRSGPHQ